MTGQKKVKNKRKKIKIISSVLVGVTSFLFLVIIQSARWFMDKFGELDISVAIYQILSPLEGTSSSVLWEYCRACLFPAIFLSVIILFSYRCYDAATDKLYCDIHLQVYHYLTDSYKNYNFQFRKKFNRISKAVLLVTLIATMIIITCNMAVKVGLPEYIQYLSMKSEVIEMYYVSPGDIDIKFPDKKRNLIILYLESMENTFASQAAGGGEVVNYIPELTQLAEEGVNFSNTNALGGGYGIAGSAWTIAALLTYQTGVPYKLPVDSTVGYQEFLPGLEGMGEVLEENGYTNYFMCGSDTTFGGRRNLFEHHGNYVIYDWLTAKEEDFIPEDYDVFWGMEDAKLYEYAKEHLEKIGESGEPFNFTMLTVDTHFPKGYLCERCENKYEDQYANVIDCASRQAYEFVRWVQNQEWYANTTIVIVGDHLSMNDEFFEDIRDFDRRIYNCFYNIPEGMSYRNFKKREFNTTDLCPTILASIGVSIEGERLGIGTNLFSGVPTLQEKLGADELNRELNMFSDFYYERFVIGED